MILIPKANSRVSTGRVSPLIIFFFFILIMDDVTAERNAAGEAERREESSRASSRMRFLISPLLALFYILLTAQIILIVSFPSPFLLSPLLFIIWILPHHKDTLIPILNEPIRDVERGKFFCPMMGRFRGCISLFLRLLWSLLFFLLSLL